MLNYIVSILIWMLIVLAESILFRDKLVENGWVSEDEVTVKDHEDTKQTIIKVIAICAIPVFREAMCACMCAMAFVRKEDFKW